jgi:hypothetical protein
VGRLSKAHLQNAAVACAINLRRLTNYWGGTPLPQRALLYVVHGAQRLVLPVPGGRPSDGTSARKFNFSKVGKVRELAKRAGGLPDLAAAFDHAVSIGQATMAIFNPDLCEKACITVTRNRFLCVDGRFQNQDDMETPCSPLLVRSASVLPAHEPRLPSYYRPTRSKIIRARLTLSDTTAARRGDGRLISASRARRTAAMIATAMTIVDFTRVCSCIFSAQASRSLAVARFISPISALLIAWATTKSVRELSSFRRLECVSNL